MKTKLKNTVDPRDPAILEKPLWIVYGHECWPRIFACKIRDHGQWGKCIWGYSVYKGEPGYRTFGSTIEKWFAQNSDSSIMYFFDDQEKAMTYLNKCITPKI